jgi:hypothetical protein
MHEPTHEHWPHAGGLDVPPFDRLNYFYGQMLGALDFRTEQDYFREKLKLHNRFLHGYGVACGLLVSPAASKAKCEEDAGDEMAKWQGQLDRVKDQLARAEEEGDAKWVSIHGARLEDLELEKPDPKEGKKPKREDDNAGRVWIFPGVAFDCEGNELVVRRPIPVDMWSGLSRAERRELEGGKPRDLYLSLCYDELPIDPTRPVLPEACGAAQPCVYGKLRDCVCVKASLKPPADDDRCDPCQGPCRAPCVLLAKISGFRRGAAVEKKDIDNDARRPLGVYTPTTITGISWVHGAAYKPSDAKEILGGEKKGPGLEVTFSRPVLAETLQPGVVEIWVLKNSRRAGGQTGTLMHIGGEFVQKGGEYMRSLVYRDNTEHCYCVGDRIHILVRGAFILDRCCRPVDGTHVGGRVPPTRQKPAPLWSPPPARCVVPPAGHPPWKSGVGGVGGTFESWFYIEDSKQNK